ncbi:MULTISPECIES: SP_1767 family glycosyltransferase [Streptococcus]|uniref:General stress protein A n=2 Tax=Streptococcus TaxID=1301 RepID=A0A3R9M6L7_STRMT|nr:MULTISPECIES: SP_1767 family glycosyltransferase [Streptococcus]RSJ88909.1 General stress protein A [Streptococcus mitis]RSJ95799.1 General stress protein A [Streptococcus mitis]TPD58313.1 SP_1767 family glycosyltransferase [Streptococcus symci]
MNKTIVLAGDCNDTRQLETTIKSILYYNRDVKIYILNQDIMPDWFRKPRKIARMLGSDIIDVKLPEQDIFHAWIKQTHISSIAYARYFIPDYIQEDTVLYLDCDLLVNDKLDSLFEQDIKEHYIAAIRDANGQGFNTGVLLINNEKWRQEKLKERLIEQSILTIKEVEEGRFENFNGDQTIFNQVLQDDWLELDRAYNLQVGHDVVALYNNWQEHLAFNDKPVVIHFTTYRKPWTTLIANRYRDLWWQFHDLEWSQILQHHIGEFELISPLDKEFSCLTLTNSQDLEGIEELVTALPDVVFHIAAWTDMGDKLTKLAIHDNVRLYPQIVPPVLDRLKKSTSFYLDINHGSADENFLKSFKEQGKTLLAFQSTQHGEIGQIVFENGKVSFMIDAIKDFKKQGHFTCFRQLPSLTCLTFTASQDIEQLDYLAEHLPNVVFQVAAWTDMGPKLYDLSNRYPNIQLYPAISRNKLEELKEKMDVYLDINLLTSTADMVAEMAHLSKPILAFYKSQNGNNGQRLYSSEHPERMLVDLQKLINKDMLEKPLDIIQVKGIDETLDYIIEHNSSLVRFGDGEINMLAGHSIPYQDYDEELVSIMRDIIGQESREDLVVCLPDAFSDRFRFTSWAIPFWKDHMDHYMDFYRELCSDSWYGSTFVSRPYIDFEDKSQAKSQFQKLKSIWKNRDLLIVEGATSRSGVGNDLFDEANSIKRIICPSHSAFSRVHEIEDEIEKYAGGRLILCMLGPTAKVLAYHLSQKGYQVLDIGHIDSEYEWMKMGAKTKVKFSHKHTAEYNFDQDIEFIEDETYNSQIVAKILE